MKKQNEILIQLLKHIGAIIFFFLITFLYFTPSFQGKVIEQSDVTQYMGASHEGREYNEREGGASAWIGSMFSGMPGYQVAVFGGSPNFLTYVEKPLKVMDNRGAAPFFAGMMMAYIMFCMMGFRPSIAIVGAIGYAFSSYNIIILEAGHITKAWALAYFPLVIAGFVALMKKKYLIGGVVMALGLALEIKSNHLQMTYYLAILVAIIYIAMLVKMIKEKELIPLFKISGILLGVVAIAVMCNLSGFYSNYEMSKESTRGKSELTTPASSEKQSSGLTKDYVFGWSYGKAETLSFLIPNIHGGASGGWLDRDSHLAKAHIANGYGEQVSAKGIQSNTYWGEQPGTSGPIYFGAIICFLFVLGMIIIPNKFKWVLFGATVFFVFLSWGKNMAWFNDFFFYYFPMYSKFRAVSSALVIPALTVLIVAVWGLNEFFDEKIDKKKRLKDLYIAFGFTGGLILFVWLMGISAATFISGGDAGWAGKMPEWYYKALLLDREALFTSDVLRSFIFVLLGAATLWLALNLKAKKEVLMIAIPATLSVFILIDMWGIDRRYLNEESYKDASMYQTHIFKQTVADQYILNDKAPSHRVLNVSVDPFTDATTSYYHKSIGGYHAAKLKRYQELIDYRLGREVTMIQQKAHGYLQNQIAILQQAQQTGQQIDPNQIPQIMQDSVSIYFVATNTLNALNAKYVIYHPELPPVFNPRAFGNGWYTNEYEFVNNADEEIAALSGNNQLNRANMEGLNAKEKVVIDKSFEKELAGLAIVPDSLATIVMTEYKPDMVKYATDARSEQLAVLSEIYYSHGWQAYIDGQPVPHVRANYILRAVRVPAGKHELIFKFEPKTYNLTCTVTTATSGFLVLLLLGMLCFELYRGFSRKSENE